MQATSLTILESAVAMGGFLTADTVDALARDEDTRDLKCLIRAHEGRKVVPVREVPLTVTQLEQGGWHVRDVSLTADECARLREHG